MMFKSLTATLLTFAAVFTGVVQAQSGGDDVVNWASVTGVAGLKSCARSCLTANVDVQWGNEDIIVHLGCPIRTPTVRCVCVADHLYLGRQWLYTCAVNRCGAPADGETLQNLLSNFCAGRGFTAISTVTDTLTVPANGTQSVAAVSTGAAQTSGPSGSSTGTGSIPTPTKSSGEQLQLNGPLAALVGGAALLLTI